MDQFVFFSAGHGYQHFLIDQDTFDRSLYYNLLFQPKLAWSDQFLFQGTYLLSHLARYSPRESWLEVGLKKSLILPFYRTDANDPRQLLRHLKESKIGNLSHGAEDIAERLAMISYTHDYWPDYPVGEAYRDCVRKYFALPEPPTIEVSDHLCPDDYLAFWDRCQNEGWARQDIERACERTERKKGRGMQLTELCNATAQRLLPEQDPRIDSVADLIGRLQERRTNSETIRDIELFYTIACELYVRNLADAFSDRRKNVLANSPSWNYHVAAIDYWRADLLATRETREPASEVIKVDLPTLGTLRNTSGLTFEQVRFGTPAENYFDALQSWRKEPTEVRRNALLSAVSTYARDICDKVAAGRTCSRFSASVLGSLRDLSLLALQGSGIVAAILLPKTLEKIVAGGATISAFVLKRAAAAVQEGGFYEERQELQFDRGQPGPTLMNDVSISRNPDEEG